MKFAMLNRTTYIKMQKQHLVRHVQSRVVSESRNVKRINEEEIQEYNTSIFCIEDMEGMQLISSVNQ